MERDFTIASACATSLSAFFANQRRLFEADELEPVSESYFDESDLEVCFTVPYEAFVLFEAEDAPQRPSGMGRKVGRNDPCPCGSGRKYKKCHLPLEQAERASQRERARDHDLDGQLVRELGEYATSRFGNEWWRFNEDFVDPEDALQLAVPWSVYQYRVQGQSVLEWYLEEHGGDMSRAERGWLAAQQAAWLSVWEVIGVEPGETVTLRDLISQEERCVREASASRALVVRDALLARVVDHEGVSLLCGVHPRSLPPVEAAEVVRRARGRLRRKRAVPVERLREEAFGRYLIKRWEEAVFELDSRAAIPPEHHNTDGDPLLLTTDHFEFEPAARAEVESRLAGMEGAEADDSEQDEAVYVFMTPGNPMHASWENTVIGRAWLAGRALRLESNSVERADALRARVEAACGDLLRHRAREHADPMSPSVLAGVPDSTPETLPPEAEQLLLEFKQRHYDDWIDQPLPVLEGKTPREAARTAQGRAAVDVLLKDMENHEQRSAGDGAFDFSEVRRELRLE